MITSILHNFKSPTGQPVFACGLRPVTLIAGPNESGKTAVTQAANAVVYGRVPELRGRTSNATKAIGDVGGASTELRSEIEMAYGDAHLSMCIEASWTAALNAKGEFGTKPVHERPESLQADHIIFDLLDIEASGEAGAIFGTTSSLGWMGLYRDRFEAPGLIVLTDDTGKELVGDAPDRGPVASILARIESLKAQAKAAKTAEEELQLRVKFNVAGADADARLADAKRLRAQADAEVKIATEQGKRIWGYVRQQLNLMFSLLDGGKDSVEVGEAGTWAHWLKGRHVNIDAEGRLCLGDHAITSGAGAWMARIAAAYAFSTPSRAYYGRFVLITIEDDPFDHGTLSRWPWDILKTEPEGRFQVIITMPSRPYGSEGVFDLPPEMAVVLTPLPMTTWTQDDL